MRLGISLVTLGATLAATMMLNYRLGYWPFPYRAEPLQPKSPGVTFASRVRSVVVSTRSRIPEMNPDAAALDDLISTGHIDRIEFVGGLVPTNEACDKVAKSWSKLFSRANRLQEPGAGFASNTPLRIAFFCGTNCLEQPVLYDRKLERLAFGSYYFSVRQPTNFYIFFLP